MANSIETFFDAWALDSHDERLAKITASVDTNATYVDPRTPAPIKGVDALTDYVGMFSANAPGWSAKVVNADTSAGMVRATVAFNGPGPDGNTQTQLGQYFVELQDDLIIRMVGFVGTGTPAG